MMKNTISRREFKRIRLADPVPSSIKMVTSPFNNDPESVKVLSIYIII